MAALRIATWNINSLRLRLGLLKDLVEALNPDVICLQETKVPDLLIEDRIFDTYTPEKDDAASVRNGIARKIEDKQTHRVVVDLRNTTQTEASVRAALRADAVEGLREVIIVTEEGVGQPFRPLARPMTIPEE